MISVILFGMNVWRITMKDNMWDIVCLNNLGVYKLGVWFWFLGSLVIEN